MLNIRSLVAIAKILIWTTFEKANKLLPLLFITTLLVSCARQYVDIEDPSKKIELHCFSITLPSEGNWRMKDLSFPLPSSPSCSQSYIFTSGNEEDFYAIKFSSDGGRWRDKYSAEYLLDSIEKKSLNTDITFEIIEGVKDICVKRKFEFFQPVPPTIVTKTLEGLNLNTSDKYFIEEIRFWVMEGPHKDILFSSGLYYEIGFIHVSVNENTDPEFEAKALKLLENVENTLWKKEEVE